MSSSEVRIIDHGVGNGYTVTTGESVVIGHTEHVGVSTSWLAFHYLDYRRQYPDLSDSALVALLIRYRAIPGPTPDDN